jgi:hypothetical protein
MEKDVEFKKIGNDKVVVTVTIENGTKISKEATESTKEEVAEDLTKGLLLG